MFSIEVLPSLISNVFNSEEMQKIHSSLFKLKSNKSITLTLI